MISYIITTTFLLCLASQILLPITGAAMATNSETDRLALLSLKAKLTNGVPESLPSWNDSTHFCKWQGVTCNLRHMRVSALNLTDQDLGGTLAPSLGNLTFLKLLNLPYNGLHGQIPKEIGHLKRLLLLNLSQNYLEGEIPTELANCSKLQQISFTHNSLRGEIPFWFGSMQQLKVLVIGANRFHGNIPSSLGNLSSLERLSLSSNNLEGTIPQSLGGLTNLYLLYINTNNLSGMIPSSFYNLSRIEHLSFAYNYLSGTIQSNIGLAFPSLQNFFAGHNMLTGTIPTSLSNISQLKVFAIYENAFSGIVPTSLGRLQSLSRFGISTNHFGSQEGHHDLDFLSSLTNCTQLYTIEMLENKLNGVLPSSIGNLSSQLDTLSMGYNRIFGSIPNEVGQLDGLTSLSLGHNLLQGTIPDSIGKLTNLGELFLEQNQLSGKIPDVFENLTKLFKLSLFDNTFEGAVPTSLRHCKGMQFLYMSRNEFSGNIPKQTFDHLESLIHLYMSSNSLTGPIPSVIGNMKQLVALGLSENNLSGEIPAELGGCLQLTELDIHGNFFHGSIPSSFSSLKSLINIDLSNNSLSGTIPQDLRDLPILETLDLSHNHFYGEVPKGGVFDNITAISLTGNENLCGGITQLKLPICPSKSKKHLTKVIILIIVISGAITCLAIFLIICKRRKHNKLASSGFCLQNAHLRVSYKELQDATNGFSSSNLVGVGSFGSVYKGTLHFERPVAIKVLNLQAHGATNSFIAECKTLSKVRHRNLLKILTSCSSVDYKGNDFKAIVFEFMQNGSLENWLSANEHGETRNSCINFRQRLDVAIDVAHALDYLHHDFEETIVHCDIKPSNVLLSDDMVAHLGDFGLARLLHEITGHSGEGQTKSSAIKGTIGYIPPEYGESGQVTTQGDIYSYGVVMLEMLTGKKPTDSMFHEDLSLPKLCKLALPDGVLEIVDSRSLVLSDGDHRRVMQNSDLEHKVQESFTSFARIGVACCAELPNERMDIKNVLAELFAIKQQLSTFNIVI